MDHAQAQTALADLALAVTYRPVAQLRPDPKNARLHSKAQIGKLARSMQVFGFVIPILTDSGGGVIAGHARLLAAKQLGMAEVPTICLEHLSKAQIATYKIADNRLAELATWDDRLLGESLQDLSLMNLDLLETTGFDLAEIDVRIEGLDILPEVGKADPADAVPTPAAGPAVSAPGDLWRLGRHRIYCGDALKPESYAALLDVGERADMAFTDMPYNVSITRHVGGLGSIKHREFGMASGEMSPTEFEGFMGSAMDLMVQHSRDGAINYHCMDWAHLLPLMRAAETRYSETKNLCFWMKDNGGMGSLYRSQHECVLVVKCGSGKHVNNVQLGRFGRNRSNVWRYPGANSFAGRKSEEGNLLAMHPTVKPVQLVADAILDCSARGDLVLDPFLGSGTTVIAAERVGRRCVGMELDPLYSDAIVRRWQVFTGDQARLASTGATFEETTAIRGTSQGGVS